jgi:Tol biopolymer transport system component
VQRAPRWSRDDRSIAFESRGRDGHWHIWTTDLHGAPPRQVTSTEGDQVAPTWSQDGRSLYFAGNRGDGWAVWRVPADGGPSRKIVEGGGPFAALESPDGRNILYQEKNQESALFVVPVAGGRPRRVVDCASADVYAWTPRGIYYVSCHGDADPPVYLLDPASGRSRMVTTLEHLHMPSQPDLAISHDDSTILYSRLVNQDRGADLWMIDNFK